MKELEQLKRENQELKIALGIASSFPIKVKIECRKLIKLGHVTIDSIIMLQDSADRALYSTSEQNLADIKADAVRDYESSLSSFAWTAEEYIENIINK
jgi:hypothetical protein